MEKITIFAPSKESGENVTKKPARMGRSSMKIGTLNPTAFALDNGEKSLGIKSPTLWGIEEGKMYPIVFFRKPKHISQEDFDDFMSRIEITIKADRKTK